MSDALEEAYIKRHSQHLEDCKRDLVVGAKVYKPEGAEVIEGVVMKVECGTYGDWRDASFVADPNGDRHRYWAKFRERLQWEAQPYQLEWFFDIKDARKELVKQLNGRITVATEKIEGWRKMVADLERQNMEPKAP